MPDLKNLIDLINEGSLKPEKVFQRLSLPVTELTDVKLFKSPKGRKFIYKGKELYSPEIVALCHYTDQGHIGVWSEGLAIDVLIKALEKYIKNGLFHCFEMVEPDPKLFQVAEAREIARKYVAIAAASSRETIAIDNVSAELLKDKIKKIRNRSTRSSDAVILEFASDILSEFKDDLESLYLATKEAGQSQVDQDPFRSIYAQIKREEEDFENKMAPVWLPHLISGDLIDLAGALDRQIKFKSKLDAGKLLDEFRVLISNLEKDRALVGCEIQQPVKNENKTDPHNKFCNTFTTEFAHSMLNECDIEYLFEFINNFYFPYPRWDLTLIDKNTKKLRFVEVKMEDKFTEYQLRRLPDDIVKGVLPELCVVKPDMG